MKLDQLIISHEPNNLNIPFNLPNNDLEPQSNRQIKPTKLRSDYFFVKARTTSIAGCYDQLRGLLSLQSLVF